MKNFLLASFLILLTCNLTSAQTTALDWTKNDCNGTNHNLFDELNNGNVILCEYVMTCGTCISAANYLNEIYQDYASSNPGKVKFYAIDWNASFTCSTFQSWATNLSCTLFLNGYDEVNYYGGMGMPTIVVLGGADHTVYYSKLGYNNSADNANVRAAIDEALNTTGISENNSSLSSLNAFPNPSTGFATISYSLKTNSPVSIEVSNMIGGKMQTINLGQQSAGVNYYSLNTGAIDNGLYIIQITAGTSQKLIKLTVMN